MESAIDHPCQSLADWKTMDELGIPANGGRFVLSWAYHPRALPLAVPVVDDIHGRARGMDVVVLRPPGFELPPAIMDKARQGGGGSREAACAETTDRREAMQGAHVIYAKSWSSTRHYGDKLGDQALREELVALVRGRAVVRRRATRLPLHALPAGAPGRRGRRPHTRRPAQHRDPGSAQPDVRADGRAVPNDEGLGRHGQSTQHERARDRHHGAAPCAPVHPRLSSARCSS